MEKSSSRLSVKIGICLLMTIQFTQGLVSPGLAAMQAAFPDSPSMLVQLLSTVALLFMFASIFVAPGTKKIGYRKMTILTLVLMFIGAIGVAVIGASSFWGVFVCRMIYGVGYGFAFALALAYCGALYKGKERSAMLGVVVGCGGVASMVFSFIAGTLSGIDWTLSFWFMAAYILIVGIICIVLLPEPEGDESSNEMQQGDAQNASLPYNFWVMIIFAMLGIAAFTSFMNNAAMVIIGAGLGEAGSVATVFTCMGIGMMVGSFAYPVLHGELKRFTHPVLLILFAIAFIGFMYSKSVIVFTVFTVLFGFAFGLLNPCWDDLLLGKARGNSAKVSSIFVATQGIGQFASPVLLAGLAGIFGFEGVYSQWEVAMPSLCVAAIVVLVLNIVNKKS